MMQEHHEQALSFSRLAESFSMMPWHHGVLLAWLVDACRPPSLSCHGIASGLFLKEINLIFKLILKIRKII